jgi:anaerobic magnesium-protoporphyrin IX monomethyl ester cyclase
MKVGLILAVREQRYSNPYAALGLGYVAASVRANLPDVKVVIKERLEDVIKSRPDVVGISSPTENYSVAVEYAKKIKEALGVPVVIGGVHISILPQSLDEHIDVGVVGEGEKTFVELLRSIIDNGGIRHEALMSIPGLCFRDADSTFHKTAPRELEQNLDALPRPNLEELPFFHNTPGGTCVVSSRGCPYHCSFCISEKFHQKYRSLSDERIADDVEELAAGMGFKHIVFYDDLLIANKRKVLSLISLLREKGLLGKIAFSCAVRANLIDEEMCILLKAMNVVSVGMGVESFSDKMLVYYNKAGVDAATNQQALDLLHAYGITVNPSFIFAAPVETKDDMLTTLRAVYRNFQDGKLNSPTWAPLIPYPGTKIWDHALERRIVSEQMDWDRYQHHFYLCEEVSQEEFRELMDEWLVKFTLLLANEPSKGGTFIIRDRAALLKKIDELRPRLASRRDPEIGDDLILRFKASDLPKVDKNGRIAAALSDEQSLKAFLAQIAEHGDAMLKIADKVEDWDKSAAFTIRTREQAVRSLAARVNEITQGKLWKTALFLRKIRVLLAPPRSGRARAMHRIVDIALAPYRKIKARKKLRKDAMAVRPAPAIPDADRTSRLIRLDPPAEQTGVRHSPATTHRRGPECDRVPVEVGANADRVASDDR